MADSKNSLVPQTAQQVDAYHAKGSDFPVSTAESFTKQSGSHGTASGKDQMATLSANQEGPRHIEDGGPGESGAGTPTAWNSGGRSARVAAAFPIKTGSGEGNSAASVSSNSYSVNLADGSIQCSGYSKTKVGEVAEDKVHISSR